MKIGPISENGVVNKVVIQSNKPPEKTSDELSKSKDKVEISTEGRKKLSQQADNYRKQEMKTGNQNDQLSARVLGAKNRMEAGHYDLDEVKDIIVDKLTGTFFDDIEKLK